MSQDTKAGLIFLSLVAIVTVSVSVALAYGYVQSWRALTDNGYIQEQLESSTMTKWVKADSQPEVTKD